LSTNTVLSFDCLVSIYFLLNDNDKKYASDLESISSNDVNVEVFVYKNQI